MQVLVAYATRHGATAGIAEQIASALRSRSMDAIAAPVDQVAELDGFDAVVLGSAAYGFRWLEAARRFATANHQTLVGKRVWLFSCGPSPAGWPDQGGRDIFEASRPEDMIELDAVLGAEGSKVFCGSHDPDVERHHDAIGAWADAIVGMLQPTALRGH